MRNMVGHDKRDRVVSRGQSGGSARYTALRSGFTAPILPARTNPPHPSISSWAEAPTASSSKARNAARMLFDSNVFFDRLHISYTY